MNFAALSTDMQLLIVVGGIFLLTVAAVLILMAPAETPATRLAQYTVRRTSPGTYVETMGANERLLRPVSRWLIGLIASTAPQRVRDATAAQLIMAGLSMRPTVFLAIRGLFLFGFPLVVVTQLLPGGIASEMEWGMLLLSIFWGRRLPGLWLKRKIRARQRAIDRGLPYALDLMVACLEGGLSFDGALAKVAEQSEGPLAVEVRKTMQEMALGRPAASAVRDLGERTQAPDLKLLTESIVQAERMGISISDTLRVHAQESRVKRRQRAEEMGRKAPIKMVPVLIFFVLPSLAIVIMTPAALILFRIFESQQ